MNSKKVAEEGKRKVKKILKRGRGKEEIWSSGKGGIGFGDVGGGGFRK